MMATRLAPAPPHPHARRLWRRWTLATAAGELAGFAVPAAAGVGAIAMLGEPATVAGYLAVIAMTVPAGLAEGAILGFAQWSVLRGPVRRVPAREWVGATSLAAGAAWLVALPLVMLRDLAALPSGVLLAMAVAVALVVLTSIGLAQWLVLRRYVREAGWWAPANVVAWLAGLPITFIGPALVPDGSPAALWLGVGVVCGLLMGLIVGAITGVALVRIVARQPAPAAAITG
jgi:hypothetical protein